MKSGKIILGAAAAVVTVGSALAFRTAHKFNAHNVFAKVTAGGKCVACNSLYFTSNGGAATLKCRTAGALHHTVAGTLTSKKGFFTAQTTGGNKCTTTHLVTKVTKSN